MRSDLLCVCKYIYLLFVHVYIMYVAKQVGLKWGYQGLQKR
jgi:hypothetical protein